MPTDTLPPVLPDARPAFASGDGARVALSAPVVPASLPTGDASPFAMASEGAGRGARPLRDTPDGGPMTARERALSASLVVLGLVVTMGTVYVYLYLL